jgi:hypothetical protein
MKKGIGSGVGSGTGFGSNSQRYGSRSAPKCHGSPTLVRQEQSLKDICISEYRVSDPHRYQSGSGSSILGQC